MKKLKKEEIQEQMKSINKNWKTKEEFICRDFKFKNFIEAFSFMTSIALKAEKNESSS